MFVEHKIHLYFREGEKNKNKKTIHAFGAFGTGSKMHDSEWNHRMLDDFLINSLTDFREQVECRTCLVSLQHPAQLRVVLFPRPSKRPKAPRCRN